MERTLKRRPRANRISGSLTRAQMGDLAGLSDEGVKSLMARGQLPLGPMPGAPDFIEAVRQPDIPEEWLPWCDERGYTPTSGFALIVSNEAVQLGLTRDAAAPFAAHVVQVGPYWRDISRDSKKPGGVLHIFLARFGRDGDDGYTYALGTLPELGQKFKYNMRGVVMVSLTQCAADMRKRAKQLGIDLENFWSEE